LVSTPILTSSAALVSATPALPYNLSAQMKRWMEQGDFLLRRLPQVRTAMSLTVLAYNLKRALTIRGMRALRAAMS